MLELLSVPIFRQAFCLELEWGCAPHGILPCICKWGAAGPPNPRAFFLSRPQACCQEYSKSLQQEKILQMEIAQSYKHSVRKSNGAAPHPAKKQNIDGTLQNPRGRHGVCKKKVGSAFVLELFSMSIFRFNSVAVTQFWSLSIRNISRGDN